MAHTIATQLLPKAKRVAASATKELALAADRVRPAAAGITVLIYHRVGGGSDSLVDLPVAQFRDHLEQLTQRHRVIRLGEAVEQLAAGGDHGSAVVLTFDDGTADFVEHAVPLLAEFEVPATLYVATGYVDGGLSWPGEVPPISRQGLREAVASGWVDLGSHTHRHVLLDRLEPHAVAEELDRSIELIGEWCGVPALDFAYPKAIAPSSAADHAVRARFRSAALATPGANQVGQDPHALRRTPMQRSDQPRHVAAKMAGGMTLEAGLRTKLNGVRYRGRTS